MDETNRRRGYPFTNCTYCGHRFTVIEDVPCDCAPLNGLIDSLLDAVPEVRFMRDLTRGGLATVLNEIADQSGLGVQLDEQSIPYGESTTRFCEILGLDPLYLANEGKIIIVVPGELAEKALSAVTAHPLGAGAAVIGRTTPERPGIMTISTIIGGTRIVDMLTGDPLPRIC